MTPDPLQFDLNGVRVARAVRKPLADDSFRGLAVAPFTIVIDSREQLPWSFDGMDVVVPTVVKGLASGDYSIQGMEDCIACERKSLDDLYGSVTWGRGRFEREIERMNEMGQLDDGLHPRCAFVMIEATWPEIMDPAGHRPGWINQTEPRSVVATVLAWSMRYHRVHWITAGDRRHAEIITFGILQRFWKESKQ